MRSRQEIESLIRRNCNNIAFVIGNGINRYPNNPAALSWDDLLITLWEKISFQTLSRIPEGVSITEFYDLLELENISDHNIQKEVVSLMDSWEPMEHHKRIVESAKALNAPVLTTNFDITLSKTLGLDLMRIEHSSFTDFYPWSSYYGDQQLKVPTDGFGIWHINGMANYHRSIRLGLTHYMGSVERTRGLIHQGKEKSLFYSDDPTYWQGYDTWLHIIFNKPLFIFGLGLEENEIFLRWLLIERTKYFRKYPERKQQGWYLTTPSNNYSEQGKKFFLQKIGFEVLEVADFKDIYELEI